MITLTMIQEASQRIESFVHRTPVLSSRTLATDVGAHAIQFKCENFQKTGAFKARGACNAVLSLPEHQAEKGVLCHSSGNHGAALAYAASIRKIPAYIVMPEDAPSVKKEAVASYGAKISFCSPGESARNEMAEQVQNQTGATLIHPFENENVIAGQGTLIVEMLEQVDLPDTVVIPLGGGGLISGCSLALRALAPSVKIIGVEPDGADDTIFSLAAGKRKPLDSPESIADGLLMTVGEKPFSIIQQNVDEVVRVTDSDIRCAVNFLLERAKLVVEPSGAVGVAALRSGCIDVTGQKVLVVLSGGNVDLKNWNFSL